MSAAQGWAGVLTTVKAGTWIINVGSGIWGLRTWAGLQQVIGTKYVYGYLALVDAHHNVHRDMWWLITPPFKVSYEHNGMQHW